MSLDDPKKAAVRPEAEAQPSVKLNQNSIINALKRKNLAPLKLFYAQMRGAPAQKRLLGYAHLRKEARMPDQQPVLLHMSSTQFSRLFGAATNNTMPPHPFPAAAQNESKRDPKTMRDLERLASYLCNLRMKTTAEQNSPKGHPFYEAWLEKARSGTTQQQSMREVASGCYLLYRPSAVFPGRYVVGFLLIYVTSGDAVATYELNRLRTPTGRTVGPSPDVLDIEEEHHGYAIRKSGCLLIRSWEESSGEEQVAVFSLLNDDHKKYTHVLDGHYLGILSATGPTSRPAVMLRQGDCKELLGTRPELRDFLDRDDVTRLLDSTGIVSWDSLPEIVKARLSRAAGTLAYNAVPRPA